MLVLIYKNNLDHLLKQNKISKKASRQCCVGNTNFCFKENNQWNYKGVFDAVFQRKGHNCKAWQKMLYLQQKISRIKNGAKAPLRG